MTQDTVPEPGGICSPADADSSVLIDKSADILNKTTPAIETGIPHEQASSPFHAQDGLSPSSSISPTKSLKPKRSALFYPSETLAAQSNARPFAKSAAKRESVHALGSIQHLQHLYAKQGLASKQNVNARSGAFVPALGFALPEESAENHTANAPAAALRSLSSSSSASADTGELTGASGWAAVDASEEDLALLPPSPKPSGYRLPPYPNVAKPVEADYEALRPEALQALECISELWRIKATSEEAAGSAQLASINAASLIRTTKSCIRAVRTYLVALPSDAFAPAELAQAARLARDPVKDKDQYKLSRKPSTAQLPPPTSVGGGSGFLNVEKRSSESSSNNGHSLARRPSTFTLAAGADSENVKSSTSMRRAASTSAADEPATSSSAISLSTLSRSSSLQVQPTNEFVTTSPSELRKPFADDGGPAHRALSDLRKATVDVLGMLHDLAADTRLEHTPAATGSTALKVDPSGQSLLRKELQVHDNSSNVRRLSTALSDVSDGTWSGSSKPTAHDEEAANLLLQHSDIPVKELVERRVPIIRWIELVAEVIYLTDMTLAGWRPRRSSALFQDDGELAAETTTSALVSGLPAFITSSSDIATPSALIASVAAYLPPEQAASLLQEDTSADEQQALDKLSDAYLLCLAFNAALRNSRSPWGMIQARDIHEMEALQQPIDASNQKSTWTFQRTQNLQCWATSLRRRYAITGPKYPAGATSEPGNRSENRSTLGFNAALVAKKEAGWERELLGMITAWLAAVATEH